MSEFDCGWVQDESEETEEIEYCECECCGRLVICRKVDKKMLCSRCIAAYETEFI